MVELKIHEYEADGDQTVLLDGPQSPLVADFSREGVDLNLSWPTGEQAIVKDYFSTINHPDIETPGGAHLDGELVVRLAGPGPMAQSQTTANDESPIGEIETLAGEVTVQHSDGTSETLVEGSAVFKGDILQTGADGSFMLVFADDTKLAMGENGRVVLDDFVYNSSSEANSFGISLLQGIFSVVSGLVAKDDYDAVTINTPVGTIGIRGTSWAGKILAIGEESVFTLFTGSIIVANEGGSQLLTVANQSVFVSSYTLPPSLPFIMDDDRLLELYGEALGQVDPNFRADNDDFDPDAIAPAAGGGGGGFASGGGGAGFNAFIEFQGLSGLDLGVLLERAELLDPTRFRLPERTGRPEDPTGENPTPSAVVEVSVVTATGSGGPTPLGFNVNIVLDNPATSPTTVFFNVSQLGGGGSSGSSGGSGGPVSNFSTFASFARGPAPVDPDDLSFLGDGFVVIAVGETQGSLIINILDDDIIENTEYFLIELTGAENAEISPVFSQALLVVEDDDIGVLTVQPANGGYEEFFSFFAASSAVPFGNNETPNEITVGEGEGFVQLKVVLDKALGPGVELSVDYAISGTAEDGADFTSDAVKTITFSGGEFGLAAGAEMFITIPITDDTIWEGDESFSITLVNASDNAIVDPESAVLTVNIIDNEIPIAIEDDTLSVKLDEDRAPEDIPDYDLGLYGGSGTLASLTFNTDQPDFAVLGLESGGVPVVLNGLGTNAVVGMAGAEEVFRITLNSDGTYDVQMSGSVDHPVAPFSEGGQVLEIPIALTVVDQNGSSVDVTVSLNVEDDEPRAFNDQNVVFEGDSATGNVVASESSGDDYINMDGASVAGVENSDGVSVAVLNGSGEYVINGLYGQLILQPDGDYTYNAFSDLDNSSPLTDVFTYQLKDADEDVSEATLSIAVKGVPSVSATIGDEGFVSEDTTAKLEIQADTDDVTSELTSVVVTGLSGWSVNIGDFGEHGQVSEATFSGGTLTLTFYSGIESFDDYIRITPPENSDTDRPNVSVTVNIADKTDSMLTDSASTTVDITVDAVVDGSQVEGTPDDGVENGAPVALNLSIALGGDSTVVDMYYPGEGQEFFSEGEMEVAQGGTDTDGSESVTEVVISLSNNAALVWILPAGFTAPEEDPAGTWTFDTSGHDISDVNSLIGSLKATPEAGFDGVISVTVTTTTVDTPTDGEEFDSDNTDEDTYYFDVSIANVPVPPVAINDNATVSENVPVHAVIAVDTSGSMTESELELVGNALGTLITNIYADDPHARITLIDFDSDAYVYGTYNDLASALEDLEGLSSLSDGSTNYEAALDAIQTVDFKEGYDKAIYFLSDGSPTLGSTQQAINGFNAWVAGDLGGAAVYSVGINIGSGNTYLGQIDTTPEDNTAPADYLVVDDLLDLGNSLNPPAAVIGNILANDSAGETPLATQPIQSIEYDGVTYNLLTMDEGIVVEGSKLTLGTLYGELSVDFVSGAYEFSPTVDIAEDQVEVISYTIVGMDGLTASADLTITVEAGTNFIFGGNEGETLNGTAFDDDILAGYGFDTLVGGQGDDTLTGGDGNDAFMYTGPLDGHDTITDFEYLTDTLNLDVLFDNLGLAPDDGNARAELVAISTDGSNQTLTINGASDFSITFENFSDFGTGAVGDFSESQLAAMKIIVE